MIICRDCGHQNEDGDQFCGSCGAFLEFTGDRIVAAVTEEQPVEEAKDSEFLLRTKRALDIDNETLAAKEAETARVAAQDAAVAAEVVAKRQAEKAAAEQAQREADAKRRIEEREAEQTAATERAAAAEAELARVRDEQQREAENARRAQQEYEETEKRRIEQRVAEAQEQARRDAEEEKRKLEERIEADRLRVEAENERAAKEAAAALEAEQAAARERAVAQQRLDEAAAAAAALALRAAQESDALAAAEAAKLVSEAEAERSRAESASAAAAAAEEVARARAEAQAAKAEAAELRARAQEELARTDRERQALLAEKTAADEQERAKRRVEEEAAAERVRRQADNDAAQTRRAAEIDAAERKAEAELAASKAEEKAAAARADEERARLAAEAESAKREREKLLQQAAALVAPKEPVGAKTGAASTSVPGAAKKPGDSKSTQTSSKTSNAGSSTGAKQPDDSSGKVKGRLPGEAIARQAPKRAPEAEINPGDLVCGNCGVGNVPTRKFCRRCGKTMAEAIPAKLGFFARLRAKRRLKKQKLAGSRPGMRGGRDAHGNEIRAKGRAAWWKANATLSRIGALLGIVAMFGFGVEPIRSKLHLPNVRQSGLDAITKLVKPRPYDQVRALSASASSGNDANLLIDTGDDTSWLAAPSKTNGVGSVVTVNFDKPFDLGAVSLISGLHSPDPEKRLTSQPRPSELRVIFNNDDANPITVPVADDAKPQTLKLKHKDVTQIRFEVTNVYPSVKGGGTSVAMTELEFFQRRKFGDDFETLTAPRFNGIGTEVHDDNLETTWVSSPSADGVGTEFSMDFATPTDISRLRIAPGHPAASFKSTPRPHEIQLAFTCQGQCDTTKQISLKDAPGFKNVNVTATGVTHIDVTVRSVYGSGGGVAISEIQVQRKRPKADI